MTTLHSFNGDGLFPEAGLVQGSDSNFYGTTFQGGTNGFGTVFRISSAGTLTTLYQFEGTASGGYPGAGLVQGSDGNFYGTDSYGGDYGDGTVFRISSAGTFETVYPFGDGVIPRRGMVQGSDGNFYGTTSDGGTSTICGVSGCGSVFKLITTATLAGSMIITNGGALVLTGTNSWTIPTAVSYGGGASGGSIVSSNGGSATSVALANPAFQSNNGTLVVVGGNDINYGQIGGDLTNLYSITGYGSLTGTNGASSFAILNEGTIASVSGGTLTLNTGNASDFGGVQNASNGTMLVSNGGTLAFARTAYDWTNAAASFPTNSGTVTLATGQLRGQNVGGCGCGIVPLYVNGTTGLIHGCGTIENFATVLNNGTILADCGGLLTFTGILTNNGLLKVTGGSTLEVYGTVVNNGTIDIVSGTTNFHGAFINNNPSNSPAPAASSFQILSLARQSNDMLLTWQTFGGSTNVVQAANGGASGNYNTNSFMNISPSIITLGSGLVTTNYLDSGGATNTPSRFYRIEMVQ